jgi:hypothetical protein
LRGSVTRAAASTLSARVGQAEQLDHAVDIFGFVNPRRHPARIRQDVVGTGPAGSDELVTDGPRERQVGDPVTVQVAEPAAIETKFDAPEAMWSDLNPIP